MVDDAYGGILPDSDDDDNLDSLIGVLLEYGGLVVRWGLWTAICRCGPRLASVTAAPVVVLVLPSSGRSFGFLGPRSCWTA